MPARHWRAEAVRPVVDIIVPPGDRPHAPRSECGRVLPASGRPGHVSLRGASEGTHWYFLEADTISFSLANSSGFFLMSPASSNAFRCAPQSALPCLSLPGNAQICSSAILPTADCRSGATAASTLLRTADAISLRIAFEVGGLVETQ